MHRTTVFAFALLGLLAHTTAAAAELVTPRGATLQVIAEFPPGPGPFPTVILAPGGGYHMALPALERTARRLVEGGVGVYRFNWAYFSTTPRGNASSDLAREVEDMRTVVAAAKSDPRVRATQLWAAGKSLGSMVAVRVLVSDKALRGGVLLTPICNREADAKPNPVSAADEFYPGLRDESRPLVFVLGDRDPGCAPATLYAYAAGAKAPSRIAIVGGDHGFGYGERPGAPEGARFDANLKVVAEFVTLAITDLSAP